MSNSANKKPLMRSLGEFVGHIFKGIRTDPARKVVRKDVQETVVVSSLWIARCLRLRFQQSEPRDELFFR